MKDRYITQKISLATFLLLPLGRSGGGGGGGGNSVEYRTVGLRFEVETRILNENLYLKNCTSFVPQKWAKNSRPPAKGSKLLHIVAS